MNEQKPRSSPSPNQMETNRLWKAFLGSSPSSEEPFRRFLESRDARYSYSVLCDFISSIHRATYKEGYEQGHQDGRDYERENGEPVRNEGYE